MSNDMLGEARFPVDRMQRGKVTPVELEVWAQRAVAGAHDSVFAYAGSGDGYVYFVFQDHRSGLKDLRPTFGRIPAQSLGNIVASLANIGAQVVMPKPGATA